MQFTYIQNCWFILDILTKEIKQMDGSNDGKR